MAGTSRRFGLGVGAMALALAYVLAVQMALSGVFAGRAWADPIAAATHSICFGASAPADPDDADRPHAPHCPFCTPRADAIVPPLTADEEPARSALVSDWARTTGCSSPASLFRSAHHPRGPPGAPFLV